jgi:DNA polymerase-3 subunit delta'
VNREPAGSVADVPGRSLAPFPWQRAAVADLLTRSDRWPHAVLVAGPSGIGKRVLAYWLARALLCESPLADGTPCGSCASCGYAAAGQHPDLRIIDTVELIDDEAKTVDWIVVDRIRTLVHWAELTSHRGGAKVAIIDPAERMNLPAANALLKTLEEPPASTFFLLVSHHPGRLPATIVSRCQRIEAPRPTAAQGRDWLAAQGIRDGGRLLAQASGAPLVARALADAAYQSERTVWLAALAAPQSLSVTMLGGRIEAGPRENRKDRLAAAVDWLVSWSADLARVRAGGSAAQNPDFSAQLSALARSVAALPLFRYHRSLLQQRALLAHPLQPRLVAEALLIDYRALFG